MNATPQTILETLKAAGLSEAADLVAQTIKADAMSAAHAAAAAEQQERQAKAIARLEWDAEWDAKTHIERLNWAGLPTEHCDGNGDRGSFLSVLEAMARDLDALKNRTD
tara:strand:- start:714 stop:1040 length:327 start_codon:yes stop_codon:yes gene_type:complete